MSKKTKDSQRAVRKFKQLLRETPLGGHRDTIWNDPRIRYADREVEFSSAERSEASQKYLLDDDDFSVLEIN
jgi:hypothetical protein